MDKRNRLSSYVDPSTVGNGHTTGPNTPSRGGQGRSSAAGGNQADTYPTEEDLDAVANYKNYANNKPSNPRNSTTHRANRYEADSNDNNAHTTTDNSGRRHHQQQPARQPRLTYYNDGESPSGGGGFKETPKQMASSANRSARNNPGSANNRRAHQPDYTNQTQINRNADLVDSRPQSARARGHHGGNLNPSHLGRERPSGLVVTPAHEEDPYGSDGSDGSFDDYESPAKRDNGRYSVGTSEGENDTSLNVSKRSSHRPRSGRRTPQPQPEPTTTTAGRSSSRSYSRPATRATGPAEFLVRIHCVRDAFTDFEEAGKPKPTTFLSLHTTEERGRTGVVADDYNPTFNDEFLFTSSRPEKDALVLSLVAAARQNQFPNRRQSTARDKKVAEAILSLQNLKRGVEREQWVSLVRHPGTPSAYERGEVLVSILSESYGQDSLPTEEEEAVYYDEVHDMLVAHAPQELHRLDWFVGNVSREGPEGLARLRAKMIERTLEPVKVRLTVSEVTGLTAPDGRPTQAETCYVVIGTPRGSEVATRTVPYRRRATFDQTFVVTIRNPDVDTVSLAVFSAGRKLGEAQAGLTNLQAGVSKEVTLMLVRAAETGDAAPAGEITVVLQTDGYNSPYQMTAAREARLRERVTAYLWSYLRDDLHRLDAIVSGIDDEDAYMKEWARTIGPEKKPRHASLRVTRVKDVFGTSGSEGGGVGGGGGVSAVPKRVYMRVVVGPSVQRTESASVRNGEVAFKSPLDVVVYEPKTDSIELMLVEEADGVDTEVSRVVLGTGGLPRGESVVRQVRLVGDALTRSASARGEMEVELVAHDFGLPLDAAITEVDKYRHLCERLHGVTERNSPETLHRVPYVVDTAPPGRVEEVVEKKSKEYGNEVASAPMTLRILGLKDFRKSTDCYVKAFLDGAAILTTRDKKGASEVTFDIDDNNETTVKLTNANQARLVFKIGQHFSCKKAKVIARTELALRSMVRGERNTVWIPLFEGSADHFQPDKDNGKDKDGGGERKKKGRGKSEEPFAGSRMPTAHNPYGAGSAKPLGLLGVMVQSNAFPGTTVTEYTLERGAGGEDGGNAGGSAYEAVTRDVTRLLMKYRPQDLSKVQPLIAECASLKEAHSELRSRFCPRPIGATIYVNIEKIELATAEGRAQEEQCAVRADISYGDEHQSSVKKREFEHDVIHQRVMYPAVRLDIPAPEKEHSAGRSSQRHHRGGNVAPSAAAAPLEIRLVGIRPGSSAAAASPSSSMPYTNGNANHSSSAGGPPNGAAGGAGGAGGGGVLSSRYSQDSTTGGGGRGESASPRRRSLGGANNLFNYLDEPTAAALNPPQDTAAADSPYAYRSNHDDSANHNGGQSQQSSATRRRSDNKSNAAGNGVMVTQGEIGFVQLSLRGLLSAPLHKVGDVIRVPIVRPPRMTTFAQTNNNRHAAAHHTRNIVGHVTLRLTLPAFEAIPEFLRLAGRKTLAEVEPKYVHYYERRIGAYLRENSPADLVDFHYKLYERDVASGRWPTSLYDWLQALIKRFGPETTNIYGPEPPLPFDPEERERQRDDEQARMRESAFADSEAAVSYNGEEEGSGRAYSAPRREWLGEDPYYSNVSSHRPTAEGKGSAADDIYEVKDEPANTKRHRHRRHQQPKQEGKGSRRKDADKSHASQGSQGRRGKQQHRATETKEEAPVYGF